MASDSACGLGDLSNDDTPVTHVDPENNIGEDSAISTDEQTQNRPNSNLLFDSIRSMPFMSFIFGGNTRNSSINTTNRLLVLKCLIILHLLILALLVSLTCWAIFHYNVRFYKPQIRPSETLIVCWLLRAIWHIVNSAWSLKHYSSEAPQRTVLRISQAVYNVVTLFWVGFAVYFLGINPREDLQSPSCRICYFLLWITIASYIIPMLAYTFICLLLYITLFLVIYFRHGAVYTTSSIPSSLIRKMKVERYRDVVSKIVSSNAKGPSKSEDVRVVVAEDSVAEKHSKHNSSCKAVLNERLCSICILEIRSSVQRAWA